MPSVHQIAVARYIHPTKCLCYVTGYTVSCNAQITFIRTDFQGLNIGALIAFFASVQKSFEVKDLNKHNL